MRRTVRTLADGREIIYYDEEPSGQPRSTEDTRDLPPVRPGTEIRRDPLTGEWVVLAAHRQTRTYRPPANACPLCPSRPGSATEIPESDYDVVVFENRFPSFAQGVPAVGSTVEGSPLVPSAGGIGRCEVVCFTSDHNRSFGELSPRRVRTVLDVWADRTEALAEVPGVRQVYPFENRGTEIGVTLDHPHGQIYGYPFTTPKTERMLAVARDHRRDTGRAVFGDLLAAERAHGQRVLVSSAHWTAFVPPAARWPVHVLLAPHRQVPDLPALTQAERDDFAEVYLALLGMLDGLYGRPLPYVAGWNQAPVQSEQELSWLHLEVLSVLRAKDKLKYLAGSESGMAVWINDTTPEQMAQRLRAAGDRRTVRDR
ncbi:galactose-1-phosphate uridylyltransferase [Tamaricihabitans halophyticus]|uniref:galactose-1-phosphate uridylyltransferase n=1 Tax=Tamaricihabitans halophyticus TaxID=1262583 RepID=UPI001046DEEE|nr:galactose-1-phosphate uridylyltransferase [Tamaricihabitans halophyticus]